MEVNEFVSVYSVRVVILHEQVMSRVRLFSRKGSVCICFVVLNDMTHVFRGVNS